MYDTNFEDLVTEDIENEGECEEMDESFDSSFTYRAVPLDTQMTLDENGTPFTLKELMDLHELREELGDDD